MFPVVKALIRGLRDQIGPLSVDTEGNLLTVQQLPALTHLVNEGAVWSIGEASPTASVIAPPTTTAGVSLYNDNPAGGKSLVVLAAFALQAAAAAALGMYGLSHCVHAIPPTTKPTADLAQTVYKCLKGGVKTYGGGAIMDLGATVVDDLWKPVGGTAQVTLASAVGSQLYVPLDIPVVLPPDGGYYSLECVSSNTSITTRLGLVVAEVKLP